MADEIGTTMSAMAVMRMEASACKILSLPIAKQTQLVMARLVPAIHLLRLMTARKAWMPGTRPGMHGTSGCCRLMLSWLPYLRLYRPLRRPRRAGARRRADGLALGAAVRRHSAEHRHRARCCSRNSGTRITARSPLCWALLTLAPLARRLRRFDRARRFRARDARRIHELHRAVVRALRRGRRRSDHRHPARRRRWSMPASCCSAPRWRASSAPPAPP